MLLVVVGCLLRVVCCWLFAVGCARAWSVVVVCWLLAACRWVLLVDVGLLICVGWVLFAAGYWPLAACCCLLVAGCGC